jgi:hypothetical protein
MLVEINLVKLTLAMLIMIVVPAVLLGWRRFSQQDGTVLSRRTADLVAEVAPLASLVLVLVVAWFGGRPLFRATERSFWSLTSLVVQPGYAIFREGLAPSRRALCAGACLRVDPGAAECSGHRQRRAGAVRACPVGGLSRVAVLALDRRLVGPAFPAAAHRADARQQRGDRGLFLAAASLFWSLADATMDQPLDLEAFDAEPSAGPVWRVAHLSDLHAVGGPYEFRLESGRAGPRATTGGQALARLQAAHAQDPVDLVVMSGDMTDGGRSTEWAAFLEALGDYPAWPNAP